MAESRIQRPVVAQVKGIFGIPGRMVAKRFVVGETDGEKCAVPVTRPLVL